MPKVVCARLYVNCYTKDIQAYKEKVTKGGVLRRVDRMFLTVLATCLESFVVFV